MIPLLLVLSSAVSAHFQELIPSTDVLNATSGRQLQLQLTFTHPLAGGPVMPMAPPLQFGVLAGSQRQDLRAALTPTRVQQQPAFSARFAVRQPGDHQFYLVSAPYWEAGEGKLIQQFTKVVVNAFDGERNWDRLLGLPIEIEALSRPYDLWTGNLFSGIVRKEGLPLPYARIEVEWRNDGSLESPAAGLSGQVIKADGNGVFHYALPRAGWWGFAALSDAGPVAGPEGEPVPLEQGGLIWVYARDMH